MDYDGFLMGLAAGKPLTTAAIPTTIPRTRVFIDPPQEMATSEVPPAR